MNNWKSQTRVAGRLLVRWWLLCTARGRPAACMMLKSNSNNQRKLLMLRCCRFTGCKRHALLYTSSAVRRGKERMVNEGLLCAVPVMLFSKCSHDCNYGAGLLACSALARNGHNLISLSYKVCPQLHESSFEPCEVYVWAARETFSNYCTLPQHMQSKAEPEHYYRAAAHGVG